MAWNALYGAVGTHVPNAVSMSAYQASSPYAQPYVQGDFLQRTFDSGKLDMRSSALAAEADRRFSDYMADKTNSFNAAEAKKARDFSALMSNTAYQRAVADMRKAGLNPYLAVSGSPASSPSAAVANGTPVGAHSYSAHSAAVGAQRLFSGLLSVVGSAVGGATGAAIHASNSAFLAAQQAAQRKQIHSYSYGRNGGLLGSTYTETYYR